MCLPRDACGMHGHAGCIQQRPPHESAVAVRCRHCCAWALARLACIARHLSSSPHSLSAAAGGMLQPKHPPHTAASGRRARATVLIAAAFSVALFTSLRHQSAEGPAVGLPVIEQRFKEQVALATSVWPRLEASREPGQRAGATAGSELSPPPPSPVAALPPVPALPPRSRSGPPCTPAAIATDHGGGGGAVGGAGGAQGRALCGARLQPFRQVSGSAPSCSESGAEHATGGGTAWPAGLAPCGRSCGMLWVMCRGFHRWESGGHGCHPPPCCSDFWLKTGRCMHCLGLPEEISVRLAALRRGYAVVAVSSFDRESKCWQNRGPMQSEDLKAGAAVGGGWVCGGGAASPCGMQGGPALP